MENTRTPAVNEEFEQYLLLESKISKKSLKFYRSDLSHFVMWMTRRLKNIGVLTNKIDELIPYLSERILEEYKNSLIMSDNPVSSINRKLSTLRHFSRYLYG